MAKDEYQFEFTTADRQSAVYKKLLKHLHHLLDRERHRNDAVGLAPETTGAIRGKISLCKELIALDATGIEVDDNE